MSRDFVSDGCTGWPDVWRGIDLSACCTAHDLAWFEHPGNWSAWLWSNFDLGLCFFHAGAWEIVGAAIMATSTIGAILFARKARRRD